MTHTKDVSGFHPQPLEHVEKLLRQNSLPFFWKAAQITMLILFS